MFTKFTKYPTNMCNTSQPLKCPFITRDRYSYEGLIPRELELM